MYLLVEVGVLCAVPVVGAGGGGGVYTSCLGVANALRGVSLRALS